MDYYIPIEPDMADPGHKSNTCVLPIVASHKAVDIV